MEKVTKTQALAIAGMLLIFGGGAVAVSKLPRGIRNNNPGNIEKGQPWQGLSADQSSDSRFAVFREPVWGLRALGKTLQTYQRLYGINTIRAAISRWAPSVENNTDAYVNAVARHVGASPDAPLDFSRQSVLVPMIEAIVRHENGQQPYDLATLKQAAALAGAVA